MCVEKIVDMKIVSCEECPYKNETASDEHCSKCIEEAQEIAGTRIRSVD